CLAALAIDEKFAPEGNAAISMLFTLGDTALRSGDLDEAERELNLALALSRKAGWKLLITSTLVDLANLAITRSDLATAETFLREALTVDPQDPDFNSDALASLASVAFNRGDLVRATLYYQRNLNLDRKHNPLSLAVATDLINL